MLCERYSFYRSCTFFRGFELLNSTYYTSPWVSSHSAQLHNRESNFMLVLHSLHINRDWKKCMQSLVKISACLSILLNGTLCSFYSFLFGADSEAAFSI
jgi:hypothetical protein